MRSSRSARQTPPRCKVRCADPLRSPLGGNYRLARQYIDAAQTCCSATLIFTSADLALPALRAREAVEALDLCARRPIDLQEQPDLDRGRKRSPLRLARARDAARQ